MARTRSLGGGAAVKAGQARIHDLTIDYSVVRRSIKYPRLEFKTGGLLLVLPKGHNGHKILIEKHRDWIYKKSVQISAALERAQEKKLDISRTDREFRRTVLLLSEKISGELRVSLNKIYFRRMKSKWGSCSSRRNLMVNTLLRYLPEDLVEYVIFHELAHLIERKHNNRFWRVISAKFENHEEKERSLFESWFLLQKIGLASQ